MKKTYICFLFLSFCLTACKKDNNAAPPTPDASFSFVGNTSNSIVINETSIIALTNNSKNAVSYLWNIGNDTSTLKQPIIHLTEGGDYTISLTVKNSTGQTSTTKKYIKVLSPVLKSIVIKTIDWSVGTVSTPNFNKADVWVEITKQDSGKYYTMLPNGAFDAPVIYKSNIYQNAIAKNAPITLSVDEKVVMNQNTVFGNKGRYGVNLYGKDATGTYLLYTSDYSGVGIGPFHGSIADNYFEWDMGLAGIGLYLTGDYE